MDEEVRRRILRVMPDQGRGLFFHFFMEDILICLIYLEADEKDPVMNERFNV